MRFTSVTQRFALWFMLGLLLPLVLIGYSLLHNFKIELQHTVLQQISSIADKKADQLDTYLNERIREVSLEMRSDTVRHAVQSLSRAYERGGVTSAEYRRLDDSYRDYFKRFIAGSGFYDLFLISLQGDVVYSQAHEADFATNLFNGPYRNSGLSQVALNAMHTLESGISEFELYAPSGNAAAAFIAVPVMIQGRVIGVLAVQIDNSRVYQVLRDNTGMGESGETVVATRGAEGGEVLMVPIRQEEDTQIRKHEARLRNSPATVPLLRALNGERGSGFDSDYRGEPVVAAWRYLPRMGWAMVVKMDATEALMPYTRVLNFALSALGLAFVVALVGAFLLGRSLINSLIVLNNYAGRIASGRFEQRVPVVTQDELGRLAGSFNSMAEHLQASYANLEEEVRQRTDELAQALKQEQKTQAAMQLSEARLNEAQRIAQVGSWELDLLTGELIWSDEIFHLFEIDRSKFGATYEAFLNAIHPEDREPVNQAYTKSLADRQPYEVTHRLQMADGRIKWVVEHCTTNFDAQGKPLRSMGTVQDISARKEAEQALEKNELLFRTLTQMAPVGIFRSDASGAFTYVNERYCEISGRSVESTLGKGWTAAIHPDDRHRVIAEWDRSVHEQMPFMQEMRLLQPDGEVLWAVCRARKETDAEGRVLGFVGTATDITVRKQAEEALKDSNNELERRVASRTEMLLAAKEEAERANNSKSLFLTSMSHELRTPLNAILGYAQLMQMDDRLPQDVIENAAEVKRAGDFLLNLINDILDLSRIESGKLNLLLEDMAIEEVLKQTYAYNIQAAMNRNVTLHLDRSCSEYAVAADKRALTQVLNNLVSNAIKYNRDGGRVHVSCRVTDAAGAKQGRIRIVVADNGPGIAADKLNELFQPFNRLGAEMGTIEGTGIGLVLARKLIEAMHGAIGVESEAGQGSTFWIELPLAASEGGGQTVAATPEMGVDTPRRVPLVLVAEDYPPNQQLLTLQLQTLGCAVDIAGNGADALALWREKTYDLILTDIDMPLMNGIEFSLALRNEERVAGAHVPLIAATATNTRSELKRYQEAGIDEVLGKPVSINALRTVMTRLLVASGSQSALLPQQGVAVESGAGATDAVLDLNYLYHILGQVNIVQARILVDTFMRTAEEGLEALGGKTDDAVLVAKEMHKQKSSARTVGALRYATLAATLEQQTKSEGYAGIAAALAALRKALEEVEKAAANLLESPRPHAATVASVADIPQMIARRVLVADDDLVVLQQMKTMLHALGMAEVLTAINGLEASKLLAERGGDIEVLVCDLSMPQMDGVELIRQLGKTGFKGGLILISGADEKVISTVNKLAVLQGVRVLGQLQKPVSAAQLAHLLALTAAMPALREAAAEPEVTGEAIRLAMAANEFSIWFQPKVDADRLGAVGVEALARWQLPGGKYVSPDSFITVAERVGLIGELSQLLVSISLREATKLYTAGFPLKVALNLSGTWLNDLNLPDFILSNTLSAGLRPGDVILEVTETGVMEDLTTALDVLSRLRLKGFGLSIDDFGIGYSSFEQLARIPFTEMKLDRSFVSKGREDAAARAILESSMDMAHKLNLSTVAEGVESELDLKLVRSLGCNLVQGYFIAKPMPVNELIVWLKKEAGQKMDEKND